MHILFLVSLSLIAMTALAQDSIPTNQHFWHTIETTAKPENIWKIWTDVPNWHTWDTGLRLAELNEPFALGAKGTITSLEGRKSAFKVVELDPGHSYTFKTNLPLGGLYVKRNLQNQDGRTRFTHEVWFSGLSGGLFAKQFGPQFRAMLPQVMENVARLAE